MAKEVGKTSDNGGGMRRRRYNLQAILGRVYKSKIVKPARGIADRIKADWLSE